MKRLGNVWEKVISMDNLRLAHKRARRDKSYYKEVRMVDAFPDEFLGIIHHQLKTKSYTISPSDYKIQKINDSGKERTLMKLDYFPNRIIQWAIMLQLEPMFLKNFCYHTCASLPGRGIARVHKLMTKYLKDERGTRFCLKMDVRKFYDSIDHEILKRKLRTKVKDANLLWLLDLIIDSYPGSKGVPIGSYLSQYLANFYLSDFDHFLKEGIRAPYVVRYMDDVVVFAKEKETLWRAFGEMRTFLERERLEAKGNWQVFPVDERGVDYIGYRYFRGYVLLSKRTAKRFKRLCLSAWEKQRRKELLNFHQWCGLNSYIGWLKYCNSYRLKLAYLVGLADMMERYFLEVLTPKHYKRENKRKAALRKYKRRLSRNLKMTA